MVEITELNREPASTVSTLTATTEVTSPSVDATDVSSETVNATTEVTSPSVTVDALEAENGAFTDSITDPSGTTITDTIKTTQQQLVDRLLLGDDFADGALTNRDSATNTPSELDVLATYFRPEHLVESSTEVAVTVNNKRLEMTTSGDGSNVRGGVRLGALRDNFKVTFFDVSFDDSSLIRWGVSDEVDIVNNALSVSNFAIYYRNDNSNLEVVENGNQNTTSLSTPIDWSTNHDISIVFKQSSVAELLVDGSTRATDSINPEPADYAVTLQTQDNQASAYTIDFDEIRVGRP